MPPRSGACTQVLYSYHRTFRGRNSDNRLKTGAAPLHRFSSIDDNDNRTAREGNIYIQHPHCAGPLRPYRSPPLTHSRTFRGPRPFVAFHPMPARCSICLDTLGEVSTPMTTPCGHLYCTACATRLFGGARGAPCAICRRGPHALGALIRLYPDYAREGPPPPPPHARGAPYRKPTSTKFIPGGRGVRGNAASAGDTSRSAASPLSQPTGRGTHPRVYAGAGRLPPVPTRSGAASAMRRAHLQTGLLPRLQFPRGRGHAVPTATHIYSPGARGERNRPLLLSALTRGRGGAGSARGTTITNLRGRRGVYVQAGPVLRRR
ncbi:hypothetical protein DAEQUDRAFT_582026 [Daedalea quercina L-15889]|uniref:RING-type domain-containing protein n=1 Tax=Daedalea quercina L-15889 TaxID=1314783 RepID=A0A165LRI2_9APHY|nr:hypothetical protein DAEQUDRAFT_582026 [Daedalea quercina L-15889]